MLKEKINKLSLMSKNIEKTHYIIIFLAIVFTLLGTVSIVGALMFLKSILKLSFFTILLSGIVSVSFYVFAANKLLEKIEQRNENKIAEFENLEKEVKKELIQNYNSDIICRFNALDKKRKIELLKTIKSEIFFNLDEKKLEEMDVFDLWSISKNFELDEKHENNRINHNIIERKR